MPVVVRESSSYSKVAPRVQQRGKMVSRKTNARLGSSGRKRRA